jgi:ferric iron reductase protein FhuF
MAASALRVDRRIVEDPERVSTTLVRISSWGTLAQVVLGSAVAARAPGRELPRLVADYARWRGASPRVAASLFLKRYALRLLAPAIVGGVAEAAVPDLSLANLSTGYRQGQLDTLSLVEPRMASGADLGGWFRRWLVQEHLEPVVDSMTRDFRLAPCLLWANVGASAMYVFTVCAATPGLGERTDTLLSLFLRHLPHGATAGRPHVHLLRGHRVLLLHRRTCCLKNRLAGAPFCPECPLASVCKRRELLEELTSRTPMLAGLKPPEE